jgi:hypothetical protein
VPETIPAERERAMTDDAIATLGTALTAEVARMYEEVASHPDGDYHFYTGRHAEQFDVKAVVFTATRPAP